MGDQSLHVVIVGAGITGLLIAQGLLKANISCTVWEAEPALSRGNGDDWGMGIHWSLPLLSECLPTHLMSRIKSATVDPFYDQPEDDQLPVLNGESGEVMKLLPVLKMHRVSRKKFKDLCSEGIEIEYDKQVVSLSTPSTSNAGITVTAIDGHTATGTILVGADGARSSIRQFLFSDSIASAVSRAPYTATRTLVRFPVSIALQARSLHPINAMAMHPFGTWGWISMLDVGSASDPTSWTFQLMVSWADPGPKNTVSTSGPDMLSVLKQKMSTFCEPFRSAFAAIPPGTPVHQSQLSYWEPPASGWDNRAGRITLAGDAAHPMTFHRGQGLNHAVADAAHFIQAVKAVVEGKQTLVEAIGAYDQEVIKRGGDEVRMSKMNTEMVHDWERVLQSPLLQRGATRG